MPQTSLCGAAAFQTYWAYLTPLKVSFLFATFLGTMITIKTARDWHPTDLRTGTRRVEDIYMTAQIRYGRDRLRELKSELLLGFL